MGEFASKRLGRPRKVAHIPNAVEEGEGASFLLSRDRETCETGLGTCGAAEVHEGSDWDRLVGALVSNKRHTSSAALAYHPNPVEEFIETPTGWVRVVQGDTGYTLNTGEDIRI